VAGTQCLGNFAREQGRSGDIASTTKYPDERLGTDLASGSPRVALI
jgi:hypothetical protein